MEKPYRFQEQAINELLKGKYIVYATMGAGKTCIMFNWLKRMKPKKVLIVTVASKRDSGDMETEADKFCGESWRKSLSSFSVISWEGLHKWTQDKTYAEMAEWTVAYDELQKSNSGISSKRGKAFLLLSKHCKAWTGYTGTPGDEWIKFYPYFQATDKIRNKTQFKREFCIEQHYPFPKILHYIHESTLKKWWDEISTAPDTSEVMSQLPKETSQIVHFQKPKGYDKALKTSTAPDGTIWDSNIAMHHGLAQMCCDTAKEKWIEDFFEGLTEPALVFYNYKCEAEAIVRAAKKAGKHKVWLINGESHDIPTAETIGQNDVVVSQYLSGGEGLNAQYARYMVFFSYNWSYSTSKQAKGRIKRIGQEKPMFFYYLTTDKTIEEDKMKALQKKKDFSYQNWATEKGVWKDE